MTSVLSLPVGAAAGAASPYPAGLAHTAPAGAVTPAGAPLLLGSLYLMYLYACMWIGEFRHFESREFLTNLGGLVLGCIKADCGE